MGRWGLYACQFSASWVIFVVLVIFCVFLTWRQNRHAYDPQQTMPEYKKIGHFLDISFHFQVLNTCYY